MDSDVEFIVHTRGYIRLKKKKRETRSPDGSMHLFDNYRDVNVK